MKSNTIKKIKTSCAFPLLKYEAKVKYNEVKKPSGIAYVLLELIQKSGMGDEILADVLERFGIPSDIHYIFAKELRRLVEEEIVYTDLSDWVLEKPSGIREATISDFSLTERGRKMFAEEAIPTGRPNTKIKEVFYSPVTRRFELTCNRSYSPIATSFLGNEFMKKIEYDDSGMEEYLNSQKTKIGLKKEEMIESVSCEHPEELVVKANDNLTLAITESGVELEFETSDERAFFERYYTAENLTNAFLRKDKYSFKFDVPTFEWNADEVSGVFIPDDLQKQIDRQCEVFIGNGNAGISRKNAALCFDGDKALLHMLDENAAFALLDKNECRYYVPVNAEFYLESVGGTFAMQLLLEKIAAKEDFERVLQELCAMAFEADYTESASRTVAFISNALGDNEYLNGYTSVKLGACADFGERMERLLAINQTFARLPGWERHFNLYAESIFNEAVKTVDVSGLAVRKAILEPLRQAMKLSDTDYAKRFSEVLLQQESKELVYQALEGAGFKETAILAISNVAELYAEKVLARSPIDGASALAERYSLLSVNMWKLCDMLGVDNVSDYTIKNDYDTDDLIDTYATYKKAKTDIEKYRQYARSSYEKLDKYDKIFDEAHELISKEKIAAEQPDKINKKYIDEQISRANISMAVSHLLIKAQYELRKILGADKGRAAVDIINDAYDAHIISLEEKDALHELRSCRNGFQHPESKRAEVSKKDLRNWCDLVFSLKGDKK